jgi:hypothetical protein
MYHVLVAFCGGLLLFLEVVMKDTVYRRLKPDGRTSRWYAVIDLPPGPDGRRRQRTTSHDTKKQAQEASAQTGSSQMRVYAAGRVGRWVGDEVFR